MRVFPEYSGPMAHWPRVKAIPGIEDALAVARSRFDLTLASNAQDSGPELVRDALERVKLERYFNRVFTARDLGASKPTQEFFRAALKRLGCAAKEAVMIGDHYQTDMVGAKQVGLWTIWYNPKGIEPLDGDRSSADVVIRSFKDLENALTMISARAEYDKSR